MFCYLTNTVFKIIGVLCQEKIITATIQCYTVGLLSPIQIGNAFTLYTCHTYCT